MKQLHRVRPGVQAAIYLVLVLLALIAVFPALFTLTNSFMGAHELKESYGSALANPNVRMEFHLIPKMASMQGYIDTFLLTPNYLVKFWNSLGLTGAIVAGQVVVSCLSGYGFAKFHFPLRNVLFWLIIILMLMPVQVTLVTQYIVLDWLHLLGSYLAVILPGIFAPFGVFLMSQVYSSIPNDMLDAAKIDGANQFTILFRIVIPYSKAGFSSLIILSFIDNWNMVEQPLVFLQDQAKYPLSIFLSRINAESLSTAFVCGVLAMIPVVILFLFLKEAMIEGLVSANLK